jgi:hypothetical protein
LATFRFWTSANGLGLLLRLSLQRLRLPSIRFSMTVDAFLAANIFAIILWQIVFLKLFYSIIEFLA